MTNATTYRLPTLTDLIRTSSVPDADRFKSADRDELEAIAVEVDAALATFAYPTEWGRHNDEAISSDCHAAIADLDAGADIVIARDDDGYWFARANTSPRFETAYVLEACDDECDDEAPEHQFTLNIPSTQTYHLADKLHCECGQEFLLDPQVESSLPLALLHESGDYRVTCDRCQTVYVLDAQRAE